MPQTFKDKVVVVTGGANGIGKCVADEFRAQGAYVYVIDKVDGNHFVGDVSKQETLEAFASHILHGTPLVAECVEGINGLTICNAAYLSSWLGNVPVNLPLDEDLYLEELNKRRATSKAKKDVKETVAADMSSTFGS